MDSGVCIIGKTASPQALLPDPLGGGGKHPSKTLPTPMYGGNQTWAAPKIWVVHLPEKCLRQV